ncbi:RidA family protein [Variovorax sp.]|jgi:2-iminobutanoate/2-iminopropanoate deaminase|uniref:RidA family protein n=1 Tax=Variovorax sp. TaxID=1871043 RepID=UPI00120C66AD|nr:RidA family protein [Variovorax sp.]TAJ59477.1 MAG: RidA family protein [Variovorax sp.]
MTHTAATRLAPADVAPPVGAYSHGIVTQGPGRWLHIAGQIGTAADGTLPESFEAQARQAWTNLVAVLRAAGMGVSHLVKVTTFLTDAADVPRLGPVRAGFLGEARPASTLLVVQALAQPAWRIEVEASAFRAD